MLAGPAVEPAVKVGCVLAVDAGASPLAVQWIAVVTLLPAVKLQGTGWPAAIVPLDGVQVTVEALASIV